MRESLFAHTLRVNTDRSKRVTKYITVNIPYVSYPQFVTKGYIRKF